MVDNITKNSDENNSKFSIIAKLVAAIGDNLIILYISFLWTGLLISIIVINNYIRSSHK